MYVNPTVVSMEYPGPSGSAKTVPEHSWSTVSRPFPITEAQPKRDRPPSQWYQVLSKHQVGTLCSVRAGGDRDPLDDLAQVEQEAGSAVPLCTAGRNTRSSPPEKEEERAAEFRCCYSLCKQSHKPLGRGREKLRVASRLDPDS
jgi:hypothetical protein